MNKSRILIVCPDASGLALLTSMLKSLGHVIDEVPNDRAAARLLEREPVGLVLACVDPGDADCLELVSYVRRKYQQTAVILMFPRLHPERAKEAGKQGATAVLKYPAPAAELRAAVMQALEQYADRRSASPTPVVGDPMNPMGRPVPSSASAPIFDAAPPAIPPSSTLMVDGDGRFPFDGAHHGEPSRGFEWIGADPSLRQILVLANALAHSSATVLIQGEPGTGRSELARHLHDGGGRGDRPFVSLHAAELIDDSDHLHDGPSQHPQPLSQEWAAKLAKAAGGTLYIKEVGALDPQLQLQLLREIQLQDMESASGRAGGDGRRLARLVLSTSEDLAALVEQGRFRQDLFHRISSVRLTVPALRRRGDDLEILANHFRAKFARQFDRDVVGFTRDALEVLQRHDWPGNVRELQGVVQRAIVLCHGSRITATHLGPILNPHRGARGARANAARPHLPLGIRPLKEALEEPEKQIILQALQALNWNRQETARMLDINRTTLYKKMKKYGLLVDEPMWVD